MMISKNTKLCYSVGEYLRLSSEDGDRGESNSITNQRELIEVYLKTRPDLMRVSEYVDDGYSGANFERPAFKRMMDDIERGRINCIIVKDLSRLGRNYIEMGKMLERVFPTLGVRFIAITDNYDNINSSDDSDGIIVPFKNLLNDAYCRDISLKVRSQLDVKRRNGEFVGSYAPYGYKKSPDDKNKLIIDEPAAKVVRDIFKWKIGGISAHAIAKKLNEMGKPSPSEYKRQCGIKYCSGFKSNGKSTWRSNQILRILKNELYTGDLIQKKRQKINYRIKKIRDVPPEQWIRVKNTHEAIISREDFDLAHEVLKMDTCAPKGQENIRIFSGLVRCGDCGRNMLRRTHKSGTREYIYFHCGAYIRGLGCSPHYITEKDMYDFALSDITNKIKEIEELEEKILKLKTIPYEFRPAARIEERILKYERDIEKYDALLNKAYEDAIKGVIDKEEYSAFRKSFNDKIAENKKLREETIDKRERLVCLELSSFRWIETFKRYRGIDSLNRQVLVTLIDHITVKDKEHIAITYRRQDEIDEVSDYCNMYFYEREENNNDRNI